MLGVPGPSLACSCETSTRGRRRRRRDFGFHTAAFHARSLGSGTGMITSESSGFFLSWVPEIEDYCEAFHADAQVRGTRWKSLAILVVGLAAFTIGTLTYQWVAAVLGFMVTVYGLLMSPMYPRQVRTLWRRSAAMRELTQCRVVAGEGLIPLSVPGSDTLGWSRFDGVLETDRVFVLQMARYRTGLWRLHPGTRILVLAKRGLDSPGDVPRLRELLIRETGTVAPGSPGSPSMSASR